MRKKLLALACSLSLTMQLFAPLASAEEAVPAKVTVTGTSSITSPPAGNSTSTYTSVTNDVYQQNLPTPSPTTTPTPTVTLTSSPTSTPTSTPTPVHPAMSGTEYFSDDFETDITTKWDTGGTGTTWSQVTDGSSRVIKGVSTSTSGNPGNKRAKSTAWADFANANSNYIYELKAKYTAGTASNGAGEEFRTYFRYNTSSLYYYFELKQTTKTVAFKKYTTVPAAGYVTIDNPKDITTVIPGFDFGIWHNYKVEVSGDSFKLYIDNILIMTTTPDGEIRTGTVGFANRNSELLIDDVKVSPIAAANVDKTLLNSAIANAQAKYDAAVEGTQPGQYPTGSKAVFQSAIDVAKAVLNNNSATQAEVDVAVTTLNNAVTAFEAARILEAVYFSDGFETDIITKWDSNAASSWSQITDAASKVMKGASTATSGNPPNKRIKTTAWTDFANTNSNYTLNFKAKYIAGTASSGAGEEFRAMFRTNPTTSLYYYFEFKQSTNTIAFKKYSSAANAYVTIDNPISIASRIAGFSFNAWHDYKIIVAGNSFKLYIDNTLVMTTTQDNEIASGTAGFAMRNSELYIDDVKVTQYVDNEAPVITHEPVVNTEADKNIKLTASISDASAVNAQVFYAYNADVFGQGQPMTKLQGNEYSFEIPGAKSGVVNYYITAVDAGGKASRSPSAGYYTISIKNLGDLDFEARKNLFLDTMARREPPITPYRDHYVKTAMFLASARLQQGIDVQNALDIINSCNDNYEKAAMFFRYMNMENYLRHGHLYPQTLKSKVKSKATGHNYIANLSGYTDNQKIMEVVAGYLAAQTWPDWKDSASQMKDCAEEINYFIDTTTRYGLKEFDSQTYVVFYTSTMVTLYDFAKDPVMKQKAKMMLEWLLANIAGEWMNGYYVSSTPRTYSNVFEPQNSSNSTTLAWLYFGGTTPEFADGAQYSVPHAVSAYSIPDILRRIGQDRSVPYIHKESHDLIPSELGSRLNPPGFNKYTYITKDFGVTSQFDGYGSICWSDQMRRWLVKWVSDKEGSTFFGLHPLYEYNSTREHNYLGVTQFEQVLQNKGTIVAVYNIDTAATHKDGSISVPYVGYIEAPFIKSSTLKMVEDSGWIFTHNGKAMLAVRPLKPYIWTEDRLISGLECKNLRSEYTKNGLIVEIVSTDEYARQDEAGLDETVRISNELQRFADAVKANTSVNISGIDNPNPAISYRSLSGDNMAITYNGERTINGIANDYSSWPLIDSPYMHQDVGGDYLLLQHGEEKLEYDFNKWSVSVPAQTADLVAADVSWSPETPAKGDAVIFSADIRNSGLTGIPAGNIKVDFFMDGSSTPAASTVCTSAIGPRESVSITGTGKWTALGGIHTVKAVVDTTGTVTEADETNNDYSKVLETISPLIKDITVSQVSSTNGATVTANITDDVPVTAVNLYYRYGTGGNSSFQKVAMVKGDGSTYSAAIPGSLEFTLNYYIEAVNALGKATTSMFADNFSDKDYTSRHWSGVPYKWWVASAGTNKYFASAKGKVSSTFLNATEGKGMTDYDFELDGKFEAKDSGSATFFLRAEEGNYYAVEAIVNGSDTVEFKMHRWLNNVYQSPNIKDGIYFSYDPTLWHHYKVEARGNKFIFYIDGNKVFTAVDPNNYYSTGYVGLKSKYVGFQADNVVVSSQKRVTGFEQLLIHHKQPSAAIPYNADITAQIEVSDTGAPVTVTAYYKYDGGSYKAIRVSQDIDKNFLVNIPGSNYSSTISYYLEARDGAGRTARYPLSGDVTVSIGSFKPYFSDFEADDAGKVPAGWTANNGSPRVIKTKGHDNADTKVLYLSSDLDETTADKVNTCYIKLSGDEYSNLDNYKLSFWAKYESASEGIHDINIWRLRFRTQDNDNYYDLEWGSHNSKYVIARRTKLGGNYILATEREAMLNKWCKYELEVNGYTFKLTAYRLKEDGSLEVAFEQTTEDYGGFAKGYIQFGTVNNMALYLDDIRIERLETPYVYNVQPKDTYSGIYSAGQEKGLDIALETGSQAHSFNIEYRVSKADGNKEQILSGSKSITMNAHDNKNIPVVFEQGISEIGTYEINVDFSVDGIKIADKTKLLRIAVVREFAEKPEVDLDNESKFGFNTHYALNWKDDLIDGMRKVGARHHRSAIDWSTVDKNMVDSQGNHIYDYSSFEPTFSKLDSYGFNQIAILNVGENTYYEEEVVNTAAGLDAMRKFAENLTDTYKGRVRQWEMPNEPEGFFSSYVPLELVDMQRAVYRGMKSKDLDAVLVAGDHTSSVQSVLPQELAAGSYYYADAYSYHPYIYNAMPDGNLQNFINGVKSQVDQYGGWKDYYLTEGGWPTSPLAENYTPEEFQRDYIVRAFLIDMVSDQVKAYEYYDYKNDGTDPTDYDIHWGITDVSGRPKLAYTAVNNLMTTLDRAHYAGRLNTGDEKVFAHVFINENQPVIVAWKAIAYKNDPAVIPPTSVLRIPVKTSQVTLRDINGKDSIVNADREGFVSITVSSSPVYIMNTGNDLAYSSSKILLSDKYNDSVGKIRASAGADVVNNFIANLDMLKASVEAGLDAQSADIRASSLEQSIKDTYRLMNEIAGQIKLGSVDRAKGYVALEALYNYAETVSKSLILAKNEQGISSVILDYEAKVNTVVAAYTKKIGQNGIMPVSTSAAMRVRRYGRLAEKNNSRNAFAVSYAHNLLAREFAGTVTAIIDSEPVKDGGLQTHVTPIYASGELGEKLDITVSMLNYTNSAKSAAVKLELPGGWKAIQTQSDTLIFNGMASGAIANQVYTIHIPETINRGLYYVTANTIVDGSVTDSRRIRISIDNAVGAEILPVEASIESVKEITLKLTGITAAPKSGRIIIKDPSGKELVPVTTNMFGGLENKESMELKFKWDYHTPDPYNEYKCYMQIIDTVNNKEIFRDMEYSVNFTMIQKTAGISIDGNLSDWKDAYPIHLRGKYRNNNEIYDPANLEAVAYTKWDGDNFYIAVAVTDDIHNSIQTGGSMWRNDSIQLTLDPKDVSTTYDSDDMEFGFSLDNYGQKHANIFYSKAPNPIGEASDKIPFAVVRDEANKKTYYEIKIPVTMIADLKPQMVLDNSIGFNITVNDADMMNARDNFTFWTRGIGDRKDPSRYDQFTFVNVASPYSRDAIAPEWPAESKLTISDASETSLKLSWAPAVDNIAVTGYKLYKNGVELASVGGNVTTYVVTGLKAYTEYTFKVEAGDAENNWGISGPGMVTKTADLTPPVIELPDTLTIYQTDALNLEIKTTDSLSGIKSVEVKLDGKTVANPVKAEALTLDLGSHSIEVAAVDKVGNRSVGTLNFIVTMDIGHLDELLDLGNEKGYITNHGILNSLQSKVKSIQKDEGDTKKVLNGLKALRNEVEAQSGKKISSDFAALLLKSIEYIENT